MRILCFVSLFVFIISTASAAELIGKVVGVHDGDTVMLLTPEKERIKIRLDEIDAPELKQPYGMQSKKLLSNKIFEKDIKLAWSKKDRYGRTLGKIYLNDKYINAEMIKDGGAWVYRAYSKNKDLIQLEEKARENKKGLWALQDDQVIAPWEWRKNKKTPQKHP